MTISFDGCESNIRRNWHLWEPSLVIVWQSEEHSCDLCKCRTTAKDRSHALQNDDEDSKLIPMSMNYCVLSYILVIVVFVFGHVIAVTWVIPVIIAILPRPLLRYLSLSLWLHWSTWNHVDCGLLSNQFFWTLLSNVKKVSARTETSHNNQIFVG